MELNSDFSTKGMSSDELTAVVSAWQAGAISRETMFDLFRRGEVLPLGRTDEEETKMACGVANENSTSNIQHRTSNEGSEGTDGTEAIGDSR
jgi:hypothetical protein